MYLKHIKFILVELLGNRYSLYDHIDYSIIILIIITMYYYYFLSVGNTIEILICIDNKINHP